MIPPLSPSFSRQYHSAWLRMAAGGSSLRDEALHLAAVTLDCPCPACETYRARTGGDYLHPEKIQGPPYKPTPLIPRAKRHTKPVGDRSRVWGTQTTPD